MLRMISKSFKFFLLSHVGMLRLKVKENKKVKKKDQVEPSAKLLRSKVEKSKKVKQKN